MDLNMWSLFDTVATAIPDRPCIRWRGREWTYAQLRERATRLANVLAGAGLGLHTERSALQPWESGQDLVGLYLLNGPEYLEANLAGYGARTAPFNVNYRYVADELAYLLDDAGAGALVYHERFAPTVADVLPRLARRPMLLQVADGSGHGLLEGAVDYEAALAAASPELAVGGHSPDDLYVLYTGGTTGMPKGTLWRQGDIFETAIAAGTMPAGTTAEDLAAAARDKPVFSFLPNAPFMHGAAQWLALRSILTGDVVVINDVVDRLDPADVWRLVESEQITSTLLVGEAFARPLLDHLDAHPVDTSSLRVIIVGGAVTGAGTKARLVAAVPGCMVVDAAGASETGSGLTQITTAAGGGEPGVFQPSPWAAVLDVDLTRRLEPGHDGVGWYAKQGRIPLGYLGDRAKTERTFPTVEGVRWSVPGDRARLRADGMVELLGRDSVTINTGGEKVFAEEVEAAVLTHPAVRDVIVVPRPSEQWGQEVVAVVALRDGAEADDDSIRAAAAAHIARYKLPKAIVRVDSVLRSPAGKADYGWARRVAAGDAAATS